MGQEGQSTGVKVEQMQPVAQGHHGAPALAQANDMAPLFDGGELERI